VEEAARFAFDDAASLAESLRIVNYQFNAHGIELGHCYDTGAVVHDGSTYSEKPRDPALYHHPTTRPGARLAHARLERDGVGLSSIHLAALTVGVGCLHDPHDDWVRVREVDDTGCVLVRPDRHVGWRSMSSHDDPRGELLRVTRTILSRYSLLA
jgi:2,4-dichlorophenol 6-monooxygenase